MTYAKGSNILASDFNNFAGPNNAVTAYTSPSQAAEKIAALYGVGYGNRGYGQTTYNLDNVIAGNPLNASDWANLRNAINVIAQHQGTSTALLPPTPSSGNSVVAHEQDSPSFNSYDYQNMAELVDTNRYNTNGGASMTLTTNALTITRSTTWGGGLSESITAEAEFNFSSENQARYFFNSGGEVRITLSHTNIQNATDTAWNNIFTNIGTIKFSAQGTSRTGSAGSAQAVGYYQLTNTNQVIFNGTNIGSGNYTSNDVMVYARVLDSTGTNGGNGYTIRFTVILSDQSSYSGISVGIAATFGYLKATSPLSSIVSPSSSTIQSFVDSGTTYEITNSLRFRQSNSGYLSTMAWTSGGTPNKLVTSFWMKRGDLTRAQSIFETYLNASNYAGIWLTAGDQITFYNIQGGVTTVSKVSTMVFRDPSAWYHIVVMIDTTLANAEDRFQIWVNGSRITSWSTNTNTHTQNNGVMFGYAAASTYQYIGGYHTAGYYFNGYLAEIHFQWSHNAGSVNYFGEFNADGVWVPKQVTGINYGTYGYYLPFTNGNGLMYDITSTASATAPYGGVADNAKVSDTVYLITNTSAGSAFDVVVYDFGVKTYFTKYTVGALYFTGGTSTFQIQTSDDGTNWTSRATLNVTGAGQNWLLQDLNIAARYIKIRAVSFGVNGYAGLDAFLLYQDTLGLDYSGTYNSWRTNNISLTSGTTYDWMTDTPTNNYCTLNQLNNIGGVISNSNLQVVTSVASATTTYGTFNIPSTGKWYWEFVYTTGAYCFSGVGKPQSSGTYCVYYTNGQKYINGTGSAYGASYTLNDIIGVAVDSDAGTITFYKNNVSQGAISISFSQNDYAPYFSDGSSSDNTTQHVNFGQRPFTYTPPSGYQALCTANLPTPTIVNPKQHFDIIGWAGDSTNKWQTNATAFNADLCWIKNRSAAYSNVLIDIIRGNNNGLRSNSTAVEDAGTTGVLIGGYAPYTGQAGQVYTNGVNELNATSSNYISWRWKANGIGVTNTDGSITSTVSANQTAGFSIITFSGSGSAGTVGHGLGVTPAMLIFKSRNNIGTTGWNVWHQKLAGSNYYLSLSSTAAQSNASTNFSGTWNSTVFGLNSAPLTSGANVVAYAFAEIPGYSKFGSYVGNTSANGPFVWCGFRPKFILLKNISVAENWGIIDTARDAYNVATKRLYPNLSDAEFATGDVLDIVSNGFKFKSTSFNSGNTYVFAAFAEYPFGGSNISPAPAR